MFNLYRKPWVTLFTLHFSGEQWVFLLALILAVGIHDACHQLVANNVTLIHLCPQDSFHVGKHLLSLLQSTLHVVGKVYLSQIACDNHLSVLPHTSQKHLDLLGGGVLCLIENHHCVIQCSSSHEGKWCNLNHILLHIFCQFLSRKNTEDRKSTRLNSSHQIISYAV